ncbi:MAG: ribose-5-phosphate isomerase rki1 [Phylliscum demangeonii]|nr:MAG: ribose-5-phosphate isomerase rki1 [Phylliscum demangeonii]
MTPTDPLKLSGTERAKRAAAYQAVSDHFDPSFTYVGIGSGSTVVYVVEAIAARGQEVTSRMTFVPTGFQSRELIVEAGLRLGSIDALVPAESRGGPKAKQLASGEHDMALKEDRVRLDVAFDGADEVDEDLNCIKGGGACLLQEKLVATSAKKFICVADSRKLQPRLLTKWSAIPIEIVPLAAPAVLHALRRLGSLNPCLRLGGAAKAGPIVTDNGNFIVDAPFPPLALASDFPHPHPPAAAAPPAGRTPQGRWQVEALASRLKQIVGVVETGLFCRRTGLELDRVAGQEPAGAAADADADAEPKPVAAYFGMENGEVQVRTAAGNK